ncbi:hypothetical protein YPPY03_0613, partial [Yersinia pestis PY-03]
MPLNKYC